MARAAQVGPETVAIVTGASSGIGSVTAQALARPGQSPGEPGRSPSMGRSSAPFSVQTAYRELVA